MTDEFRPLTASACGKQNAHNHRCVKVGHSRPYAACLWIIDQARARALNSNYSTCSSTISDRGCPALSMRQEEELAGRAIYFTPRRIDPNTVPSSMAPITFVRAAGEPSRLKPKSSGLAVVGNIADAINNYVAGKKPAANPNSHLEACAKRFEGSGPTLAFAGLPRAGESPLEFARRMASSQTQTEQ